MGTALPDELLTGETAEFLPTRDSLLSRVRDLSSDDSWREFFETYWKLIYNTARRYGMNDAEAQDVVQETMIGLVRNLPSFRYDPKQGEFKSWLKQLILWRIRDQARKRLGHDGIEAALNVAEQNARWDDFDSEWERNLFDAAVARVKQRMSPQNFQIFSFCVLQKKGVSETARVLNVSSARVYLARHRVVRAIQQELSAIKQRADKGYEVAV